MTFSSANWDDLKEEMRSILIAAARLCSTITYGELAGLLSGVHMHHRAPNFHRLIRDMDADETAAGRPSLASLVVRKDSGIPGMGFFADAPVIEGEVFDTERYWREEFRRVCEYWSEG